MTRTDREHWENGDTATIGQYTIKPKRDFGAGSDQHGWVVVAGGCNVLPGATWGRTMDEAIALMNIYIAVGGKASYEDQLKQGPEIGERFWALVSAFRYYSKQGE